MRFRTGPLRAAAVLAAAFIAVRVLYRVLFHGADGTGPVVLPLPSTRESSDSAASGEGTAAKAVSTPGKERAMRSRASRRWRYSSRLSRLAPGRAAERASAAATKTA